MQPNEWLRPEEWAQCAVVLGLMKTLIPEADRENGMSRTRGIGVIMTAHANETFVVETDAQKFTLQLEKGRHRVDEGEGKVQYHFAVIESESVSEE